MASHIAIRFLIVSDTHGKSLQHNINERVDVAIHCGDLTEESKLDEFKTTINLLKKINAPLKLVIAGNHDWTLDTPVFEQKLSAIDLKPEGDVVKREYGAFKEARSLLESEDAKANGIVYLHEGTHSFKLANGANLTVYASPYTPSVDGWGFNYHPQEEHDWAIDSHVDVVVTHCPPKGVLDMTESRQRGGSPGLFAAVARSRPKLHCFGHLHANWGAKKISWRDETPSDEPSHFTDIDNDKSTVIETLSTLQPKKFDSPENIKEKKARQAKHNAQGYCDMLNLGLKDGMQTLFVNAAIEGDAEDEKHFPWVVEVELLKAKEDSKEERSTATCEKRKRGDGDDESHKRRCSSE